MSNIFLFNGVLVAKALFVNYPVAASGKKKAELFSNFSVEELKDIIFGDKVLIFSKKENSSERMFFLLYAENKKKAVEKLEAKLNTVKECNDDLSGFIIIDLCNIWSCRQVLINEGEYMAEIPSKAKVEYAAVSERLVWFADCPDYDLTTIQVSNCERVSFIRAASQHDAMLIVQKRLAEKYRGVVHWC